MLLYSGNLMHVESRTKHIWPDLTNHSATDSWCPGLNHRCSSDITKDCMTIMNNNALIIPIYCCEINTHYKPLPKKRSVHHAIPSLPSLLALSCGCILMIIPKFQLTIQLCSLRCTHRISLVYSEDIEDMRGEHDNNKMRQQRGRLRTWLHELIGAGKL